MPEPCILNGTLPDILDSLRRLQTYDKYAESELAACTKQTTLWGILLVVSFFVTLFTIGTGIVFLPIFFGILAAVFLVLLIFWGVKRAKWTGENMEDRRLDAGLRFFSVIGQDMTRKTKCGISISFEPYTKHGQLLEKSGGFLSPRIKKYSDVWFNAKGSLCDATVFKVKVEQIIHRKEKPKRKYTKIRERIFEEITLVLRISPESYPQWEQLQKSLLPCTLQGVQVRRIQVRNGIVRIVGVTPVMEKRTERYGAHVFGDGRLTDGDVLLTLFTYVYAQLQNCRAPGVAQA